MSCLVVHCLLCPSNLLHIGCPTKQRLLQYIPPLQLKLSSLLSYIGSRCRKLGRVMSIRRYDFQGRDCELCNSEAKLLYISYSKYDKDWYTASPAQNMSQIVGLWTKTLSAPISRVCAKQPAAVCLRWLNGKSAPSSVTLSADAAMFRSPGNVLPSTGSPDRSKAAINSAWIPFTRKLRLFPKGHRRSLYFVLHHDLSR